MKFNITKNKNDIIELDCGKIIIDKEYLDIIFNIKKWNIGLSTCYNGKIYLISHFILDQKPPKGFVIDHINCNPLDNRKQNLRLITKQQNCYNHSIKANKKSSIYKGVCKNFNKWTSSIKGQFLGNFNTEKEAAEIYDKKAKELYGEFANLNFPEPGQEKYKQKLIWEENKDGSISIDFGKLIIDKEDYDKVINKRWQIRIISSSKHKDLHFYIIEKKNPKNIIDHIDGNQLNNRKENLREISKGQNSYNMYIRSNCSSKYKGVTFDKQTKKWVASIMYNRKRYSLGYFINEKDAGLEYNKFAKLYFGECARLNIIEE